LLSFTAGFFTGGIYLVLLYGPIALWMFPLFWKVVGGQEKSQEELLIS